MLCICYYVSNGNATIATKYLPFGFIVHTQFTWNNRYECPKKKQQPILPDACYIMSFRLRTFSALIKSIELLIALLHIPSLLPCSAAERRAAVV